MTCMEKSKDKNFERVRIKIKLLRPVKNIVAGHGGSLGTMIASLSRCCGDRSERTLSKLVVVRVVKTIESQLNRICKEYKVDKFVKSNVTREEHDTITCDIQVSDSKKVVKRAKKEMNLTLVGKLALKIAPHSMIVKKFINATFNEIVDFLNEQNIASNISMTHFGKKERTALIKPRPV